jgi:hypothetical protein
MLILSCLLLTIIPYVVTGQYCNDTTCVDDEEYIPNVTEHLWLNKINTAKQFSEDTSLKTLITFHQRFRLKRSYKFLNSLECLNCIVASKKIYKLDTNAIKIPNLKQVDLRLRHAKRFPLFILTSNSLKSIGLSLKNDLELDHLAKYSLERLLIYFDKYLADSLPSFIYNQKDLVSLNFVVKGKTIQFNDSVLNLSKLKRLRLPIELDERNLNLLCKLNLQELAVNRVKLNDISNIQKRLPFLTRLWIEEPLTLKERAKLMEANPNIEIKARTIKTKKPR